MADQNDAPPDVPSEEELTKLPRWARVAFAARCARRVQPIFQLEWLTAPELYIRALDKAIAIAEQGARLGLAARSGSDFAAYADDAARDADVAATNATDIPTFATAAAARAAARAAGDDTAITFAAFAALEAATAAIAHGADDAGIVNEMHADFELLLWMARREQWTDDTPVPPELFGPLWTDAEPDWWPEEPLTLLSAPPTIRAEFSVHSDIDEDEADGLIGEIIQRANELHHAMGGAGLTIRELQVYDTQPALEPVGGPDDDAGDRP